MNKKIIRVFPRLTSMTPDDDLVRYTRRNKIGAVVQAALPNLFDPRDLPVHISVTFTWDKPHCEALAESWYQFTGGNVELGGPAYGDKGGEFEPGLYIKKGGIISTRGCPDNCKEFCLVPEREGQLRQYETHHGNELLDNNILAASDLHIKSQFEKFKISKSPIKFSGGFCARRFKPWHRELLEKINLGEVFFACDKDSGIEPLHCAKKLLEGISINKLRCYVLFDPRYETLSKADQRARAVYKMGFLPFAQLFQGDDLKKTIWKKDWRKLQRYWSLPNIYRAAE